MNAPATSKEVGTAILIFLFWLAVAVLAICSYVSECRDQILRAIAEQKKDGKP